jgi:predicted regulator of Ras-like GTPase activity (Roadblock/LC7/MglB family)
VDGDRDDTAERLASSLSRIPGVEAVQVCSRDGVLLGASSVEPGREAFLAAFIARRAESFGDGDLRGFGGRVVNGQLDRVVLAGDRREAVIVRHEQNYVWLSLAPGASVDALSPTIHQTLQRFR